MMAGALGLGAFGLGTGLAQADPCVPQPPPIPGPTVPGVNLPTVQFPEVDNYFRLPNGHIAPGQLQNSSVINGVENPFFG